MEPMSEDQAYSAPGHHWSSTDKLLGRLKVSHLLPLVYVGTPYPRSQSKFETDYVNYDYYYCAVIRVALHRYIGEVLFASKKNRGKVRCLDRCFRFKDT